MRSSPPRIVLAACLGLVLTSALADAQFALRSKVEGTITDTTGAMLPGVTVTLTEIERNQIQTATTDTIGTYAFSNLATGTYTVTAELAGFIKTVSQPITLGSAANAKVDLTLNVGVSETVEVVKETPLVHTDQIAVGIAVDKTLIENIASKGRNFTSFVQLAPGITTQPRSDNAGTYSAGSHHVIGGIDYVTGGGGNNGFYVNGVNANDNYVGGQSYSPSLEAIDEIKVDVANFSAANGRDVSTLSVTTRAGTNRYHGAIYDYLENEALNAWNPLDRQRVTEGTDKPSLDRHQYRRQSRWTGVQGQALLLRQLRANLQQARSGAGVLPRADGRGAAGRLQRAAVSLPGRPELRALQPVHHGDYRRRRKPSRADPEQRSAEHHAS